MPPPTGGQVQVDTVPLLLERGTYVKGDSQLWARGPLRQGSPITLGPASTWKQEDFSGGVGQTTWRDESMYYIGDADTRTGTVRCRWVLQRAGAGLATDNSYKLFAIRPRNETEIPRLYYASQGARDLYETFDPSISTKIWTTPSSSHIIQAMGRGFAESEFGFHIGLQNGTLWYIPAGSSTVGAKITGDRPSSITFIESAMAKGDLAGEGRALWKWDKENDKWVGVGVVDLKIIDGEYWNQRWYFLGTDGRSRSTLYTTDLITVQPAHTWPNNFVANKLAVHNGVLYITGHTWHENSGRERGQLWAYNGDSITPVYEVPEFMMDGTGGLTRYHVRGPYSYRKWLIFAQADDGVWFYDPETDAIHPGPKLKGVTVDSGNFITATIVYSNRIFAANFNEVHFHHDPSAFREHAQSFLTTSEFDAGLPGQDKSWTEVRVRFIDPLPTGCSVDVYVTTQRVVGDNGGASPWQLLGTISTVGTTVGVLRIAGNGSFPDFRSKTLRLRLRLNPQTWAGGSTTNNTPEVAAVEVDYLVVDVAKWGWTFTAFAGKMPRNLKVPGGADYALTPAQVETQLEALRRDPAKQVFTYTDKDGATYQVKMVSFQKNPDIVRRQGTGGETTYYSIGLAEV